MSQEDGGAEKPRVDMKNSVYISATVDDNPPTKDNSESGSLRGHDGGPKMELSKDQIKKMRHRLPENNGKVKGSTRSKDKEKGSKEQAKSFAVTEEEESYAYENRIPAPAKKKHVESERIYEVQERSRPNKEGAGESQSGSFKKRQKQQQPQAMSSAERSPPIGTPTTPTQQTAPPPPPPQPSPAPIMRMRQSVTVKQKQENSGNGRGGSNRPRQRPPTHDSSLEANKGGVPTPPGSFDGGKKTGKDFSFHVTTLPPRKIELNGCTYTQLDIAQQLHELSLVPRPTASHYAPSGKKKPAGGKTAQKKKVAARSKRSHA